MDCKNERTKLNKQLTIQVSVREFIAIMEDVRHRSSRDANFNSLYKQMVKTLEDAVNSNSQQSANQFTMLDDDVIKKNNESLSTRVREYEKQRVR
jgi:hypothetical protein